MYKIFRKHSMIILLNSSYRLAVISLKMATPPTEMGGAGLLCRIAVFNTGNACYFLTGYFSSNVTSSEPRVTTDLIFPRFFCTP